MIVRNLVRSERNLSPILSMCETEFTSFSEGRYFQIKIGRIAPNLHIWFLKIDERSKFNGSIQNAVSIYIEFNYYRAGQYFSVMKKYLKRLRLNEEIYSDIKIALKLA